MLQKISDLFKKHSEINHSPCILLKGVGSAPLPCAGEQKGREQPRGSRDSAQDHI